MRNLSDQVALVTGASRGIGAEVAKGLAACGARVVVSARKLRDAERSAQAIIAKGGTAEAVVCDVTDYESVRSAVSYCEVRYGRLDILVNNAGVIDPIARLSDSDPELWASAVDVNVKGVYFGIRAATGIMLKQGAGTVINMSSGAANSILEGWSHYCSTKSAVKKLTECAHKELFEQGISVIGLSPGTVATDMMKKIRDSGINPVSQLDWSSHISAHSVGEAVVYLCTPAARDLSGTDFSLKTEEGRRRVQASAQSE